MALQQIGIRAKSYTGGQVKIQTDSAHTRARILSIDEASIRKDLAQGMVVGLPDKPGIAYQILGPVAEANIDVVMIIQNVDKDGCTDLSFTVGRADLDKALALLEGVRSHVGAEAISAVKTMCKVSVVGVGMRSHPGLASKMFRALAEEGINIQMIATSEIRIPVAIEEKYLELAVRVSHKAFEPDSVA